MKNDAVGDIIFVQKPPIPRRKTKHGVIVCAENQWMLYINTEETQQYRGPKISHRNYPFLEGKDRHIACTNVFNYTYDKGGFNELVSRHDSLGIEDLKNLQSYLMTTGTIPNIQLSRILENLRLAISGG